MIQNKVICGDALEQLRDLPAQSVDLVFGSPPYEDARTYGIDFSLKGQDWVDWMVEVYKASLRVCKGLVAFVVAGRTRNFRWSCAPALLIADLHRAGICVREGPWYHRVGIPGSGGPDWLRHDIEFIVSATNGGRLPWSDNTVMGDVPKYGPGGDPTHRKKNGQRENGKIYTPPKLANPGNLISCGSVGGGHLGDKIAHENEAPFPEALAEFMIRSFCPPNGVVCDPFAGSGTTAAVAVKTGRKYIAIDVRESQIELMRRRLAKIGLENNENVAI